MKKGFSYEEHDSASEKLQKIRDYLTFLSVEVSNSYGKSVNVTKAAIEASQAADRLRFALADELHKENPQELSMGALDFYKQQNSYSGSKSSDVKL